MDSAKDLSDLLEGWPYDPEDNVRRVRSKSGREVLQVRLPLGVEQYELSGRPDGERPFGKESLLIYHLERLEEARRTGDETQFSLSPDECEELFSEGTLYYYRYLHLFQLKDWAGTVRDTARNLQVFDLVKQFAEEEDDRTYLEQWRPYLFRMNATAAAMMQVDKGEYREALNTIHQATAQIEALEDLDDETFQFERQRSLFALKEIADQIEETQPLSELERLERQLRNAIESQSFERAADLRDRIRALRNNPK
jgi:hypothetical protein